jgi:hypothetical protein
VELQRPPLERGKVVPNTREVLFLIPLANPKRERERERERERVLQATKENAPNTLIIDEMAFVKVYN